MISWLQQTFQENSILWLVLSSIMGGFIGASAKFIFDVVLPNKLQQGREAIAIKRKYTSPILLSAQSLRDRLENIIKNIESIEKQNWLPAEGGQNYYYKSTLFVVGQFFGWVQILRRNIVYLDFAVTKETQKFERFLNLIENGFTNPALYEQAKTGLPHQSQDKWVFKYILQSLGALMVTHDEQGHRAIDYVAFCKLYESSDGDDFRSWFSHLEEIFKGLNANDVRFKRIIAIHIVINSFVDYLDPKHLHTEKQKYYWELLTEQEKQVIRKILESV